MGQQKLLVSLCRNVISRYTMWEALATMMVFGEYEEFNSTKITIPKPLVLIDVVALISLGSFMSFSKGLKSCSGILASIYILLRNVAEFNIHRTNPELCQHIFLRTLGCVASHFLLSLDLHKNKAKKRSLLFSAGSYMFSFMILGQAVLMWSSKLERNIFVQYINKMQIKHDNHASFLLNIFIILLVLNCCIFAFHHASLKVSSRFMAVFWMLVILPIDVFVLNIHQTWLYYRIIASNICTLCGFVLLHTSL